MKEIRNSFRLLYDYVRKLKNPPASKINDPVKDIKSNEERIKVLKELFFQILIAITPSKNSYFYSIMQTKTMN